MEPNLDGLETVTVKASEIADAISRAKSFSDQWQSQMLEIAILPIVADRYTAVNSGHMDMVQIVRHEGLPHIGFSPEENGAIVDWAEFAGYVLVYGTEGQYSWNSIGHGNRSGFAHGPSRCWDGVRRTTFSRFIEYLRMAYWAMTEGGSVTGLVHDGLAQYQIQLENDL